jgi:hypothetical protein
MAWRPTRFEPAIALFRSPNVTTWICLDFYILISSIAEAKYSPVKKYTSNKAAKIENAVAVGYCFDDAAVLELARSHDPGQT